MNQIQILVLIGFQVTLLGGFSGVIEGLGVATSFYFVIMTIGVLITLTALTQASE